MKTNSHGPENVCIQLLTVKYTNHPVKLQALIYKIICRTLNLMKVCFEKNSDRTVLVLKGKSAYGSLYMNKTKLHMIQSIFVL